MILEEKKFNDIPKKPLLKYFQKYNFDKKEKIIYCPMKYEELFKIPKDIIGLYYIITDGEIIYIGHSEECRNRLLQHFHNFSPLDRVIIHIGLDEYRKENEEILRIKPKYNSVGNFTWGNLRDLKIIE
jgi:hypothetical protein